MKQREKIIPGAQGMVLEVGIGSGLILEYYNKDQIKKLYGLDLSNELWKLSKTASNLEFDFEFVHGYSNNLPIESNSIDTIVSTYTLCTIGELEETFDEFRRVLKENGRIAFCEHGKAPDKSVQKWQNRINPIWKALGGGCNLNRDIPKIILEGGFKIEELDTMYIPGWKAASFNYWGMAKIK